MIFVDTNVLLDVFTDDPVWAQWSLGQLDAAALKGPLAINAVVYAELAVRFERIGVLADLFIGAYAAVQSAALLTRDTRRYRTYFPSLVVIAP